MTWGSIARFQNVGLVAIAVAAGIAIPEIGSELGILVTPLVAFLVYGSLRGLRPSAIDFRTYGVLIGLVLCVSYVLLPIGGIAIAGTMLSEGATTGFAVALAAPTTAGSAIIWTRLSRGDVQLSTAASVVSLLAAPVVTPIVLTQLASHGTAVPATSILIDLLVIVGGGTVLAVLIPDRAISPRTVDRASTLAIVLLIYVSVAGVETGAVGAFDLASIVVVSAILLAFGAAVAAGLWKGLGLTWERTLALFFTGSLKNLGIGLLIAVAYADPLVVVAVITYYVVQQFAGAAVADAVA